MSVHKDKKTGKWYYTGKYRDLSGERHDYKKRGFRTQREAKEAEEAFLFKIKGGQGRIRLKDLVPLYHEEMSSQIKKSTLYTYEKLERKHILPVFGEWYIDEIKTSDIMKWNKEKGLTGNKGKPYSQQYITNLYLHMSGLLTFAVNHKLISDNPCKYGKPYKDPNQVKPKQESEENFWEVDEYKKFISTVDDVDRADRYETLFYTGLRMGELLALQWKHYDPVNRKLSVKGSLSANIGVVTSPKTLNSVRTIDLPKKLNERLKERYSRCSKMDGFNEDYYMFGDVRPRTASPVRRYFQKDIENAGVKYITLHGLRHSHASYLLSNPMLSEAVVAERMGHTIDMLRNIYAHIYDKRRTALTDFIEDL